MFVIGITGGSGSGKSLACRRLLSKGGALIDCDRVYASLVDTPTACTQAIADAFGTEVLKPDGSLDRAKLSRMVFSDKNKLDLLNKTVHPIVIDEIRRIISLTENSTVPYFLIDAPQLFESGADKLCSCTVLVTADRYKRLNRIIARDKITAESAVRRVDSQLSEEYFKLKCDYIITNNGTEEELFAQCDGLLDKLKINFNGQNL